MCWLCRGMTTEFDPKAHPTMKTSDKMLYVGNEKARQEIKTEVEDLEREIDRLRGLVAKAHDYIVRYGAKDGEGHKAWVLDQVARALTGCPMVVKTAEYCWGDGRWEAGVSFTCYEVQGESEGYRTLVARAKAGEDGFEAYEWDIGKPP